MKRVRKTPLRRRESCHDVSFACCLGCFRVERSRLFGGARRRGCAGCYLVTPPIYGTNTQTVMVTAPRTIAHSIPGEYGVVAEKVMVSP